jgi:signal transduction histidine kinase
VAVISLLCGLGLIYAIMSPIKKLLVRAEGVTSAHGGSPRSPSVRTDDEITYFFSTFDEVLTLFKSHLREKDLREAMPLLDRVRRADQLAPLGFLSARLAHEIRNPLGSIRGLVELIQKDLQQGDSKKEYIDVILKSVDRLNLLIEELLEFSQSGSEVRELRNINELLKEAVSLARHEFRTKSVEVIEEYHDKLPLVEIDPQKIHQASLNIIRNAFQFTPEGGRVQITSESHPGSLSMSFFNTGSYISTEDLDTIFVPFFTTRKEGTGLGLCMAYHTISAHGGHIRVQSDRASGTTFTVELPTGRPSNGTGADLVV